MEKQNICKISHLYEFQYLCDTLQKDLLFYFVFIYQYYIILKIRVNVLICFASVLYPLLICDQKEITERKIDIL